MRQTDLVAVATTTGVVAAGLALLEVAIVPGLIVGATAALVPRLLSRRSPARRHSKSMPAASRSALPAPVQRLLPTKLVDLAHLQVSRSVVKTVTFRTIVTSLDFTGNYLILGELGMAAGLSAISIVGGPLFYFAHESSWNYLMGTGRLPLPRGTSSTNPALAKTITYRTAATLVEFTTNYVVVRDLGTAALLSSVGFFLGPFVYYGHERAWERLAPVNR